MDILRTTNVIERLNKEFKRQNEVNGDRGRRKMPATGFWHFISLEEELGWRIMKVERLQP